MSRNVPKWFRPIFGHQRTVVASPLVGPPIRVDRTHGRMMGLLTPSASIDRFRYRHPLWLACRPSSPRGLEEPSSKHRPISDVSASGRHSPFDEEVSSLASPSGTNEPAPSSVHSLRRFRSPFEERPVRCDSHITAPAGLGLPCARPVKSERRNKPETPVVVQTSVNLATHRS